MKATIRKRIAVKHRPGCLALKTRNEGRWKTPWATIKTTRFLNVNGCGKGWHLWAEFGCNDIACPAKLLVREEDILKAAGEWDD